MKHTGLLFQPDMARANVEGRKTMTRRVMKPQPADDIHPHMFPNKSVQGWMSSLKHEFGRETAHFSPYGQPGDLIYQKETHKAGSWREDGRVAFDYLASPELVNTQWCQCPDGETMERLTSKWCDQLEKAGLKEDQDGNYHWEPGSSPLPWRSSLFMPKWAARFWAEIVSIRVERLQEISLSDIEKEGIPDDRATWNADKQLGNYRALWERINGHGSWDASPYVWVIEYRQVEAPHV